MITLNVGGQTPVDVVKLPLLLVPLRWNRQAQGRQTPDSQQTPPSGDCRQPTYSGPRANPGGRFPPDGCTEQPGGWLLSLFFLSVPHAVTTSYGTPSPDPFIVELCGLVRLVVVSCGPSWDSLLTIYRPVGQTFVVGGPFGLLQITLPLLVDCLVV